MRFAHGETVTRRPFLSVTRDAHGREVPTYGPDELVAGVGVRMETSTEPREVGGQRVIRPARLLVDFDQPCEPRDRWIVRGDLFETEGHPNRVHHPMTGWEPGAVIVLRRVTG